MADQKREADVAIGRDSMTVAIGGRAILLEGADDRMSRFVPSLVTFLGYELELNDNLSANCPQLECESKDVVERIEEDKFQYGAADSPPIGGVVQITAMVPVMTCRNCNFQWTDHRADCLRDAAVNEHRKKVEGG